MIVIGKPSIVKSLGTLSVVIGNTLITSSVKLKILGLIIDSSLSWADHVSTKLKTCNSVLWCLYPIHSSHSELNRKHIVNTCVIPIISYMSIIWGTANSKIKNQIESMVRRAGRFVFGLTKYDSGASIYNSKYELAFP